jgi:hypothetical protein
MDRVEGRHPPGRKMSLTQNVLSPETGRDEIVPLDLDALQVGPVKLELRIFDRDAKILSLGVSDKKGLKDFLDSNGGIRVYRDGVRVYDFGEPGNDWLGLGGRRVNTPAARISNNIVIGAVSLDLKQSQGLVEKTNREGFKENQAYAALRKSILDILTQIEAERYIDKARLRAAYSGKQKEPVLEDLQKLREQLEARGLNELDVYIASVEKQFLEVRDTLLTAAGAGLSLATVIHEVEKGIAELNHALKRNAPIERLRDLAVHLSELIDGLGYLTRKSGDTKESASTLIKHALLNADYRLSAHKIDVVQGLQHGKIAVINNGSIRGRDRI